MDKIRLTDKERDLARNTEKVMDDHEHRTGAHSREANQDRSGDKAKTGR